MEQAARELENRRNVKYRETFKKFLHTDRMLPLSDKIVALRSKLDLFLTEVANEFQSAINPYLQVTNYKTCEQKKDLAQAINAQIAHLGLAIQCPKTGNPSYLIADNSGDPAIGRFQFRTMNSPNGRTRTLTSMKLPELKFVPAIALRSRSADWTTQICEDRVNVKSR